MAAKTERLHVQLVELALERQLLIAPHTLEVVHTIALVQSSHHIPGDVLVANETHIAKQLVEMGLTICHPVLLVVPIAIEWLLTFSTAKVIHVPLFTDSIHHALVFNRLFARPAYGDAKLVVTSQTVQLIVSLAAIFIQLFAAFITVVMPRVYRIAHVHNVLPLIDVGVALVAHVPSPFGFLISIAPFTQSSTCILHKSSVSKDVITYLTSETFRMPIGIHRFDYSSNDVFPTSTTARSVQLLKVVFTILPTVKLVEDTILEW